MLSKKFQPPSNWLEVWNQLCKYRETLRAPVDTIGCHCLRDPQAPKEVQRFHTLIALMLSSQTKDEVTAEAMHKLIQNGLTPHSIDQMPEKKLNNIIGKVGFHNQKTKFIKNATKKVLDEYHGTPPTAYEDLIALPGVGPKMAHLFLQEADHTVMGIGVDTHVHRIAQRLRWVPSTVKGPEDTRKALEAWLPKDCWGKVNHLLVGLGQTVCTPVNPLCSVCALQPICPNAFAEGTGTRAGKRRVVSPLLETELLSADVDIEDTVPLKKKARRGTKHILHAQKTKKGA